MLTAAVGRHVADSPLNDFQQCLLNALAADIAGDGGVLAFAGDLVDLVHIDDADFGLGDVEICRLDQLEQDILHVLAHVASLSQGGGVGNSKRHVEHLGQSLGQQGLAGTGGTQHQHVRFLQLHAGLLAGEDALVVVVHGDCQHTLGIVLPDDVLIQPSLDLGGSKDIDACERVGIIA